MNKSNTMRVYKLKLRYALIAAILTSSFFFTGCAAIGGIFKAGLWTGIIAFVLVVGIIIWIISSLAGRK